jgi:putative membrane protein
MWGVHDGMGWWMLLGSIWFVIVWGLIIWALTSAFRRSERPESSSADQALEIAKRRYAQGEITREQFEQIRQDIAI